MSMYKKDFVVDFAERTFKNLLVICPDNAGTENKGFEVTQLINSFLGILVFPQQEQCKKYREGAKPERNFTSYDYKNLPFPNKRIEKAYRDAIEKYGERPSEKKLMASSFQKMIKHLRNAIAHQNLQVEPTESDENKSQTDQVTGFLFTDKGRSHSITFSLTIEDIYNILMCTLYRIIDGIENGKDKLRTERFLQEAKELAGRFRNCTLDIEKVLNHVNRHRR